MTNPILISGGLPAYPRLLTWGRTPGAKRPSCGGSPRKAARSEAEQRLAAGGAQHSPDPQPLLWAEARQSHLQSISFQVHLVGSSLEPIDLDLQSVRCVGAREASGRGADVRFSLWNPRCEESP